MKQKKLLRFFIPKSLRSFLWRIIPKVYTINTYLLRNLTPIIKLHSIDDKYYIREVSWKDKEKLKKAYDLRGHDSYKRKVPPRLNAPEWVGLGVFDKKNGDIAYIAWIVTSNIDYINEFKITLKNGQFLLKDGFCIPEYRHQGLHTRMEQERINYCISNGANEIFIQIHESNEKGKSSVLSNGYELLQKNLVLYLPIFNIYREFYSAVKNPLKKVIK